MLLATLPSLHLFHKSQKYAPLHFTFKRLACLRAGTRKLKLNYWPPLLAKAAARPKKYIFYFKNYPPLYYPLKLQLTLGKALKEMALKFI